MASLFNLVQQSLDVRVPVAQMSVCTLILLLEGDFPGQPVDLGLDSLVNNHVSDFLFSSIFCNSNES